LAGLVDTGYVKATGKSVQINLPKSAAFPERRFEWQIPAWSNAIERDRARMYFVAYSAAMALHFLDKALSHIRSGDLQVFQDFEVPDEAIANYHPYPPCGVHMYLGPGQVLERRHSPTLGVSARG
jgi:hydrogenase large subunit